MKTTFYDLCLDILIYMAVVKPVCPTPFTETADFSRRIFKTAICNVVAK